MRFRFLLNGFRGTRIPDAFKAVSVDHLLTMILP
ncbi:hypothetical protein Ab1vBOLIVR2_gp53c [Agrobacterium phage OLIVR2]|uniref:Uncharacterized protein n=1 Tax=Agrobacterium phage OLIVR1 TaxID=2723769 RepID=A0A858MRS2_9CAUD|nr:hypothetical protein KNU98_gp056 [Agrobacterium phage OLIVR1]QIW87248.1 hypothetical protein Ab1vBOLIVR1_gp53c [Agrobacterium phage OLIVR1]QIW87356.1 hypothetical protein Ab1vBOLIVR2_gp53c [Agrobacterium phage OLIVR2]QIW87463.1 hypothetical protein Ab1vBOLIVR3_gp53c [Agrobacterium phage OLIVR3]